MTIIKRKIEYLYQHSFVKNVFSLQVGSFLGNFIQALAGIFIARLLQPELFGIYALSFGLAGLASILLGAGIQDAMTSVLDKAYALRDRDQISEAFAFLIKMTLITAATSFLIVVCLPWIAGKFYHNQQIGMFAGVVVLSAIGSTLFFSFSQIALQLIGRIKPMTILIVSDQTFRFGLSLLLIYLGYGIWGAVLGQLMGAAIVFLISVYAWEWARKKNELLPSIRRLTRKIFSVSLKKYFSYSFWVAVDRNMGNLFMSLPVVLAGVYLVPGQVTFFKLSFGFVNLALSLLGPISTLLNVEFPRTQALNRAELFYKFKKVTSYSVVFSMILTVGAIVVSPIAFKILYGESFSGGIKYIPSLIIYGGLFGFGVGLGPMWRAINRVKISILINLIILGIGIPLGLLMFKTWGIWGGIAMVTIWFTISHLMSFIYLYKKLKSGII